MVKPPTSPRPTAVCSSANNLKAYNYYCALYIDDVRLALSEINVIKFCSKPMDAFKFGCYISIPFSVQSRTYFCKHKIMAKVCICYNGKYNIDPRLAPQFLLTSLPIKSWPRFYVLITQSFNFTAWGRTAILIPENWIIKACKKSGYENMAICKNCLQGMRACPKDTICFYFESLDCEDSIIYEAIHHLSNEFLGGESAIFKSCTVTHEHTRTETIHAPRGIWGSDPNFRSAKIYFRFLF